jgi:hypothetical protein
MLQINYRNELQLSRLAAQAGKTVDEFIEILLDAYQDEIDVKDAEHALKESGGISLDDLKTKYRL